MVEFIYDSHGQTFLSTLYCFLVRREFVRISLKRRKEKENSKQHEALVMPKSRGKFKCQFHARREISIRPQSWFIDATLDDTVVNGERAAWLTVGMPASSDQLDRNKVRKERKKKTKRKRRRKRKNVLYASFVLISSLALNLVNRY